MKKLIFAITISLFLIFSIPETAFAQPNSFGCHASDIGYNCNATIAVSNCDSGHTRYQSFCDQCDGLNTLDHDVWENICESAGTKCIPVSDDPPDPPPIIPGCFTASLGEYFKPSICNISICSPHGGCNSVEGLNTAFGCIPTHPLLFVAHFRDLLIGIGGGITFLLMIAGAFFYLTSQGQPERVQRGKEVFFGALVGLVFLIFSIFLLKFITEDILYLF